MKRRLKDLLSSILRQEELVHIYNSYDIVGDIAIIRVTERSRKHSELIAETVMRVHRNVETVLAQVGPVSDDFRLRKVKFVAGEEKTRTVHKESGCFFHVDVERCYFSPRLLFERQRIAKQVGDGEMIVNMFAGVGSFSLVIARHSEARKIYSIDMNPEAFQLMQKNVRLNRVTERVIPIKGDARGVVERKLRHTSNRVLMPLPQKAFEYLIYALLALESTGGWINYYDFEYAGKKEDPTRKAKLRVAKELRKLHAAFDIPFARVVRPIGPNWYQIALDIRIDSLHL